MKKRKLAAPIVISVLVGLWLLGYAVLIFLVPAIPLWIKLLGAVIDVYKRQELDAAVVQLLPHEADILLRQFIMHGR